MQETEPCNVAADPQIGVVFEEWYNRHCSSCTGDFLHLIKMPTVRRMLWATYLEGFGEGLKRAKEIISAD